MKTIALLLAAMTTGFAGYAQTTQSAKAKLKTKAVFSPELLSRMINELTAKHLKAIYGKTLVVKKVTRDIHYPADRDTILTTNTGADKVEIFTNKYNSYPVSATITSQHLSFGRIRVGVSKAAFCKAFKLNTVFDIYQVSDECATLFFTFHQSILTEVSFQAMDCD